MKNIVRLFFASWYLLGWMIHVYLGIWSPYTYNDFNKTALFSPFQWIWLNVIIPNITIFALLLAVIEIIIGLLLISKGKWVKVGVTFSLAFNLFIVLLGLAYPAVDAYSDFVNNRLPMLVFAVAQIPLLWMQFDRSLPEVFRDKFNAFSKRHATYHVSKGQKR